MSVVDPQHARRFAVDVVRRLREAGFQALWAGGCVRDHLLGLCPKDYDVATSATPEQIRQVFGHRRTLAVGQAFGVITVLGSRRSGHVEVATFRQDADYSDGRHPDHVTFSTAEADAQRRDFTINGLFYDPVEDRVLDFVGGQADLERRLVRSIGSPCDRIAEDKLRMLRAVRIAARFEFGIDAPTLAAVQRQAHEIVIVSAERVSAELRQMLVHRSRRRAIELLLETGLLEVLLPEVRGGPASGIDARDAVAWQRTLAVLERLDEPTFSVALAALLREFAQAAGDVVPAVDRICDRLRLANLERTGAAWLLLHEPLLRRARQLAWSTLQRVLIHPRIAELVCLGRALAAVLDGTLAEIAFVEQQLARPREELDPAPLLTGDDLQELGIRPGPIYGALLAAARDAQLDGRLTSRPAAREWALQQHAQRQGPEDS